MGFRSLPAHRINQTSPSHPPSGTGGTTHSCYYKTCLQQCLAIHSVPQWSSSEALRGGLVCLLQAVSICDLWTAVDVIHPVSGVVCLTISTPRQDPSLTNGVNKRHSKHTPWLTWHPIPLCQSLVWHLTKPFRQQSGVILVLLVHPPKSQTQTMSVLLWKWGLPGRSKEHDIHVKCLTPFKVHCYEWTSSSRCLTCCHLAPQCVVKVIQMC